MEKRLFLGILLTVILGVSSSANAILLDFEDFGLGPFGSPKEVVDYNGFTLARARNYGPPNPNIGSYAHSGQYAATNSQA